MEIATLIDQELPGLLKNGLITERRVKEDKHLLTL
jgi:hypothetical protein